MIRKNNRKATLRQIRLVQIISSNPGISKRKALLKAGYSIHAANKPTVVFNSITFTNLIDTFQDKLIHAGITPDFLAKKFIEWLEAEKIMDGAIKKDYKVQIAAFNSLYQLIVENDKRKSEFKSQAKSIDIKDFIFSAE